MRRACATAGLAALHGNRRAQMRECTGLDTKGPLEMHYGPGKEPCQGDKFWLDPRNAGVMRIKSCIVVNVDAPVPEDRSGMAQAAAPQAVAWDNRESGQVSSRRQCNSAGSLFPHGSHSCTGAPLLWRSQ